MDSEVFDVAIIGAGPAGSTLAALLAGRGVRVALIDRDLFPRDKVCGEFLSYDALPLLARLGAIEAIDRAGATRIDHCRIIGSRGPYEFVFPQPARGISRLFLDELLLRTAVAAGASRYDGWAAIAIAGNRVTLQRDNEVREIAAGTIVGSWGRWGRFDQQLGRAFVRDRTHRSFGFKRHYASRSSSTAIDLYSFRGGYLGVNAVEGDVTNICGLVQAGRLAGHKGRWEAFVDTIREESQPLDDLYASHEPVQDHFLSSDPVIFRARSAVEGGVLMIGDASGIVDPLTGNGMAMAIQSAFLAAPALLLLCTRTADRTNVENEYRRAHGAFFRPRIAWSRSAALLLSRPRLLDSAMRGIRHPRIGELLLARTRASARDVDRLEAGWFGQAATRPGADRR